jgi:hypothetical protein
MTSEQGIGRKQLRTPGEVAEIVRDFAASDLKQTRCSSFPVKSSNKDHPSVLSKNCYPKPALSGSVSTLVLKLSKWKYLSAD